MRISPLDIQNKQFRAARMRGYNADDVDAFLDEVAVGVEEAQREVEALRAQASAAPVADSSHDQMKETLSAAIINAQKLAGQMQSDASAESDRIRDEAKSESDRLLSSARAESDRILSDARAEAERMRVDAMDQHREILASVERLGSAETDFRSRFESMLDDFRDRISEKPPLATAEIVSAERESTALIAPPPAPEPVAFAATIEPEIAEAPEAYSDVTDGTIAFEVPELVAVGVYGDQRELAVEEPTLESSGTEGTYTSQEPYPAPAEGFAAEGETTIYQAYAEPSEASTPLELETSPSWQADYHPEEPAGQDVLAPDSIPEPTTEHTFEYDSDLAAPETIEPLSLQEPSGYDSYSYAADGAEEQAPAPEASSPYVPEIEIPAPTAPEVSSDDLDSKDEIAEAVERMRRMLGEAGVPESASEAEHAPPVPDEDLFSKNASDSGFGDLGPGVPGAHKKRDLRGNSESEVD